MLIQQARGLPGPPHRAAEHVRGTEPVALAEREPLSAAGSALLSLVPTQLQRLLGDPAGISWLQGFAVIWVGGAALAPELAETARRARLRLSPCYGSTETGAMVTALPPDRLRVFAA